MKAIMLDDKENASNIGTLRQELKQWEKTFVAANGGRKPGRADIRKDTEIAAKYKEYDRLRRPPKEPQSPTAKRSHTKTEDFALQERSLNAVTSTPRRTPSKRKFSTTDIAILSPVREVEPTPAFIRCALGPTPQKDGQVLGIFDTLSAGTPSRDGGLFAAPVSAVVAIPGTPSKPTTASELSLSRTPQSASKRSFLDAFAGTPLKRKREDEDGCPGTGKRQFATPSFLRRSFPLGAIEEDSTEQMDYAPPFRKRGMVRSLSSIIQGLRKQEEERMDDEWDILNEIENEQDGPRQTKEAPKTTTEDLQEIEMPLGPDQAPKSDDEASDANEHGITRKPWKKKGLKRQTRRVIMRPVMHKPGKEIDAAGAEESDEEATTVPALSKKKAKNKHKPDSSGVQSDIDPENFEEDDEDENNDDDGDNDAERVSRKATKKTSSNRKDEKKEGGGIRKGIRKISAQAHANFRKLKIKNKNSKANGRGGNKRFGRR